MKSCYTNSELEELAEGLVRQFLGKRQHTALYVDIDRFIAEFLGLPVEYHCFGEKDKDKIGFISDGVTPLRIIVGNRPVRHLFPRGTVVLERLLQSEQEDARRRFTLAHEASHYIMDRTVSTASFHREYDNERTYSPQELRELLSFREAQIDRLAAALLMPHFMVLNIVGRFAGNDVIPVYGDKLLRLEDKLLVERMAGAMGVSYTAFLIRLKELHLLKQRDVSEYITQEIRLGGGVMPQ